MEPIQWFIIGGILVAAADQILDNSPWKSNNILQLIMDTLKTFFRASKWLLLPILGKALASTPKK